MRDLNAPRARRLQVSTTSRPAWPGSGASGSSSIVDDAMVDPLS